MPRARRPGTSIWRTFAESTAIAPFRGGAHGICANGSLGKPRRRHRMRILPVASLRSVAAPARSFRSEEHTSELQSLMRISYDVFCLKKKKKQHTNQY